MSSDTEIIHCLLCKGVVTYSPEEDSRYKEHLKIEHRVHFYVNWIIQKTVEVREMELWKNNDKNGENGLPKIVGISNGSETAGVMEIYNDEDQTEDDQDCIELLSNVETHIKEEEGFDEATDFVDVNSRGAGEFSDFMEESYDGSVIACDEDGNSYNEDLADYGDSKPVLIVYQKGIFGCSFCPKRLFKQKGKAKLHLRTHIPLQERKKFQCQQCKERYISMETLQKHASLCQGIKVYSCRISGDCKATFDNSYDLKEHAKTHRKVSIYSSFGCDFCSEEFTDGYSLKKHLAKHSAEKPFSCDICDKRFKTGFYVSVHKKTQHGVMTVESSQSVEITEPASVETSHFVDAAQSLEPLEITSVETMQQH